MQTFILATCVSITLTDQICRSPAPSPVLRSSATPSAFSAAKEALGERLSLSSGPADSVHSPPGFNSRPSLLSPEGVQETLQNIASSSPIIKPPPLPVRRNVSPFDDNHLIPHEKQSSTGSYSSSQSNSENENTATETSPEASSSSLSLNTFLREPPKPPPRPHVSLHQPSASQSSLAAPPLPARRPTLDQTSPRRLNTALEPAPQSTETTPNATSPPERKTFGSLPPPPTRSIGIGDKLPPARRPVASGSGSSSDSEDEDPKLRQDLLPDSSRSSRKPPVFRGHFTTEFNIPVPTYSSAVAVSGNIVAVASHHRLRVYDLMESEAPIQDVDARDIGLELKSKELKITSMEFTSDGMNGGRYLWAGTKEGHLLEIDVQSMKVAGMKLVAHAHPVNHIFRYKGSMASMDHAGKVLVFSADASGSGVSLAYTQPRVVRVADKQEFVKVLAGQLWTSARESNNGNIGASSRGPVVRIYDLFAPASVSKSVLPTEHLGTVTSGAMLASQPGTVFLGHEGGHVSLWSVSGDSLPQCEEIVKVSTSDILCLEGVNDRLWAGGRQGLIAAYDVVPKPWVMTNSWRAHEKLPVLNLGIDTYGIQHLDRLCVWSIGRDERLRFWDGLLGVHWIGKLMPYTHFLCS